MGLKIIRAGLHQAAEEGSGCVRVTGEEFLVSRGTGGRREEQGACVQLEADALPGAGLPAPRSLSVVMTLREPWLQWGAGGGRAPRAAATLS